MTEKTVYCGFERQFTDVDSALDWVRKQADYKDKSVKYIISCDRTIEDTDFMNGAN